MTIEVKFFATLRLHLGVATLKLNTDKGLNVAELIDLLVQRFNDPKIKEYLLDENGKIRTGTMILINGKNILHLDGLNSNVENGIVAIFPPAGGG